jgi:F420-non-reducing hydrogenase iron-sulfur subunit
LSECNYLYGNYSTEKRVKVLSQMLDFCGVEKERLRARWVSSAEAPEFVEEITHFIDDLKKLGPSPLKKDSSKNVA